MIFKIRARLKQILFMAVAFVLVGVLIWVFCSRYVFIGNDKIPIDSTKVRIDFSNCKIGGALKKLEKVTQMDMLELYGVSADNSLEYILLPDSLTYLIVSASKIDNASFVNSIGDLDLCFFLTEVDLCNISNATSVNSLRLYTSKISNFEKIGDCSAIKRLEIYQCNFGDDDKLMGNLFDSTMLHGFNYITSLEIGGMVITDISGLLDMQSLCDLKIANDCISDEQLAELKNAGINVEIK